MLRIIGTVVRSAASSTRSIVTPFSSTTLVQRNISAPVQSDEPIDIPNPYEKERRECILCKHNIVPNYKNIKLLSQFQSPYTGRIYGRHITGLCKQKQEQVEKAIIRAQNCALMPTYHKDMDFFQDPRLFDPEKPVRPHKY
ncbi:28S ribosomal protein S18c, mitochondrial [Ceratitis capitata]|uniref:(Mediterranean fruit fly) hypothetical protein n=1 Tax=Ceratitis capitata TaxID=7213 RepID=A0A811U123_CERCA|nr:28S ribosomal protein S18c, mitochondrial [Ceratitis capitata]CAD6992251.1 unnamed protein product [Ceratitis capitata]